MSFLDIFKKKIYDVEFYLIDAFEIYHFLPLYKYLCSEGFSCCFVAEPPKRNSSKNWFDYDTAIKILKLNGVNYKKRANYDAGAAVTTQDERLIHNYKNRKISLCYGASLEKNSFNESPQTTEGFDLKLVHGQFAYDVMRNKSVTIDLIKVGYPKYSKWGNDSKYLYDNTKKIEEIKNLNTEKKPVLLYFPTWNTRSSIDACADEFMKLKDKYFIITKAHHCTFRIWRERERLQKLRDLSDVILEGNFSFKEAVSFGDLAVVDAISGAATEVPFLKKDIKLVLLYSPIEEENQFKDIIDDFAICVKDPKLLKQTVEQIEQNDVKMKSRQEIINRMYNNEESGFEEFKEFLRNK